MDFFDFICRIEEDHVSDKEPRKLCNNIQKYRNKLLKSNNLMNDSNGRNYSMRNDNFKFVIWLQSDCKVHNLDRDLEADQHVDNDSL